jgi:hypothetical protein
MNCLEPVLTAVQSEMGFPICRHPLSDVGMTMNYLTTLELSAGGPRAPPAVP